jgi:hypothetical protein
VNSSSNSSQGMFRSVAAGAMFAIMAFVGSALGGICTPVSVPSAGQPLSRVECPSGVAQLSVQPTGSGPITYRWELETAPGVWTAFAPSPLALACPGGSTGGSFFATAPTSPSTLIAIRACVPNLALIGGSTRFNIRCVLTNPCGSATSATAVYTVCPADINCAGGATVQDIFDFLAAWFGGSNIGNFNGVNGSTVQDIFDFLAAWFAGC